MTCICYGYTFVHLGNGPFLNSYFSTIAVNLENKKWGYRFPKVMRELYHGELYFCEVEEAYKEMQKIRKLLQKLPADNRIWDYFGDLYDASLDIGQKNAKTCYSYYTIGRKNITDEIINILEKAMESKQDVYILNKIEEQRVYISSKNNAIYIQEKLDSFGIFLNMLEKKILHIPYKKGGKDFYNQYKIMRERIEKVATKEELRKVLDEILEDIKYNTL